MKRIFTNPFKGDKKSYHLWKTTLQGVTEQIDMTPHKWIRLLSSRTKLDAPDVVHNSRKMQEVVERENSEGQSSPEVAPRPKDAGRAVAFEDDGNMGGPQLNGGMRLKMACFQK